MVRSTRNKDYKSPGSLKKTSKKIPDLKRQKFDQDKGNNNEVISEEGPVHSISARRVRAKKSGQRKVI